MQLVRYVPARIPALVGLACDFDRFLAVNRFLESGVDLPDPDKVGDGTETSEFLAPNAASFIESRQAIFSEKSNISTDQ